MSVIGIISGKIQTKLKKLMGYIENIGDNKGILTQNIKKDTLIVGQM